MYVYMHILSSADVWVQQACDLLPFLLSSSSLKPQPEAPPKEKSKKTKMEGWTTTERERQKERKPEEKIERDRARARATACIIVACYLTGNSTQLQKHLLSFWRQITWHTGGAISFGHGPNRVRIAGIYFYTFRLPCVLIKQPSLKVKSDNCITDHARLWAGAPSCI